MSDSVWPHRRQLTRLPRPWDSPDKNTGVGCHFLLQCIKVQSESEVGQSCPTLSNPMDCSLPGTSVHGIFQARVLEGGAIAFSLTRMQTIICDFKDVTYIKCDHFAKYANTKSLCWTPETNIMLYANHSLIKMSCFKIYMYIQGQTK